MNPTKRKKKVGKSPAKAGRLRKKLVWGWMTTGNVLISNPLFITRDEIIEVFRTFKGYPVRVELRWREMSKTIGEEMEAKIIVGGE